MSHRFVDVPRYISSLNMGHRYSEMDRRNDSRQNFATIPQYKENVGLDGTQRFAYSGQSFAQRPDSCYWCIVRLIHWDAVRIRDIFLQFAYGLAELRGNMHVRGNDMYFELGVRVSTLKH